MISRKDIQRLIERGEDDSQVLSIYLDMSVTSENKRTHTVFLAQQRSRFDELDSDRANHHREAIGAALAAVERWLDDEFDESNKGVALFIPLAGGDVAGYQVPVPMANRFEIGTRPLVGPLAEILRTHARYGIALVNGEKLRVMSVFLRRVLDEKVVTKEAYPTARDVQAGGWASPGFQSFKEEERKGFLKEFGREVGEFHDRRHPDHWVLLGTDENVKHFEEHLPRAVAERVVHRAHAAMHATVSELLDRLAPVIESSTLQARAQAVDLVRDRVKQNHFAAAGPAAALEQLQEGKVDRLILARNLEMRGSRCMKCGFYLANGDRACPYCGGELRNGVDLVESMIRLAEQQEVGLDFVDPEPMRELQGVGALLKF
jgi:peptide subunit release factor 1 (eRF1)